MVICWFVAEGLIKDWEKRSIIRDCNQVTCWLTDCWLQLPTRSTAMSAGLISDHQDIRGCVTNVIFAHLDVFFRKQLALRSFYQSQLVILYLQFLCPVHHLKLRLLEISFKKVLQITPHITERRGFKITPEETDLHLERLDCYLFERLTMNKVLFQSLSFILMFWSNDQGQHNAGILGTVPHSKNALGLK